MDSKEFQSDMIYEILSRTSLETLDRCKAVSKGWKQLIYEPSFMPLFFKRTNNLFGYFMQDIKDNKHISTFVSIDQSHGGGKECCINKSWPRNDMRILASCNQGILCCERRNCKNYRYYISKPATRQWRALPNPKLRYKTVRVAIIVVKSKPLHFKIVRLSKLNILESMMEYYCEIFDSKPWAWRETRGVNLPYDEHIVSHNPAISIGERIYWQTYNDNVLAFDVSQECFRKFSLPQSVQENCTCSCKRLVEYEGRLGFTCITADENMMELYIWLTTSPRKYEWEKKMAVDISIFEENIIYPHPLGFCNSDIAFMQTCYEAVFCRLEDCSFTKVEVDYDLRHATGIFQFRSDGECVDFRGGR